MLDDESELVFHAEQSNAGLLAESVDGTMSIDSVPEGERREWDGASPRVCRSEPAMSVGENEEVVADSSLGEAIGYQSSSDSVLSEGRDSDYESLCMVMWGMDVIEYHIGRMEAAMGEHVDPDKWQFFNPEIGSIIDQVKTIRRKLQSN